MPSATISIHQRLNLLLGQTMKRLTFSPSWWTAQCCNLSFRWVTWCGINQSTIVLQSLIQVSHMCGINQSTAVLQSLIQVSPSTNQQQCYNLSFRWVPQPINSSVTISHSGESLNQSTTVLQSLIEVSHMMRNQPINNSATISHSGQSHVESTNQQQCYNLLADSLHIHGSQTDSFDIIVVDTINL